MGQVRWGGAAGRMGGRAGGPRTAFHGRRLRRGHRPFQRRPLSAPRNRTRGWVDGVVIPRGCLARGMVACASASWWGRALSGAPGTQGGRRGGCRRRGSWLARGGRVAWSSPRRLPGVRRGVCVNNPAFDGIPGRGWVAGRLLLPRELAGEGVGGRGVVRPQRPEGASASGPMRGRKRKRRSPPRGPDRPARLPRAASIRRGGGHPAVSAARPGGSWLAPAGSEGLRAALRGLCRICARLCVGLRRSRV